MLTRKGYLGRRDVDGCYVDTVLYKHLCTGHTSSTPQLENVGAWGKEAEEFIEVVETSGGGFGCERCKIGGGDDVVAMLDEAFGSGRLGS